jgi:hypothetical protein
MMMMSSPITVSEAQNWYITPTVELSQCDIVRSVPWGLIEAPMAICQPANADKTFGKANYYEYGKDRPKSSKEFLHASYKDGLGIVVWPDCQIDKGKNQGSPETKWYAAVAPVIPISMLDPRLHEKVRNFDRAQYFPLPVLDDLLPESYIDLRHIWPVRYSLLKNRITTLTHAARQIFLRHRFWFDTGARINDTIECPHCRELIQSSFYLDNSESDDDAGSG